MHSVLREKHDGAPDSQLSIRLWLRLLSCTMVIEKRIKRRLTEQFDTTLARFDILAALDRNSNGMKMSDLSRALLVSNGNVTALVKALHLDHYVVLSPSSADRRATIVKLTGTGRQHFNELAIAHHGWIEAMLDGMSKPQRELLLDLLGTLKVAIAADTSEKVNS
jgi:DNA-binding MarR family transcriptional regulator